ncbi:MAG TPA: GAF domain-containing protein [Sphingomonadales bacterium]|nr:GAF domain-containing protein [Sphingomonadales bacterium]
MAPEDKTARYRAITEEILSVVDGESDITAKMASVTCLLSRAFPHFYWTGFYNVDPAKGDERVVGPYQGTLGCLRIPFGKGVCGTAAARRKTQVVADVHAFSNHIACDPKSASEIVVPVFGKGGALIAVLDVDAAEKAAFDETDAKHLEALMKAVFSG